MSFVYFFCIISGPGDDLMNYIKQKHETHVRIVLFLFGSSTDIYTATKFYIRLFTNTFKRFELT